MLRRRGMFFRVHNAKERVREVYNLFAENSFEIGRYCVTVSNYVQKQSLGFGYLLISVSSTIEGSRVASLLSILTQSTHTSLFFDIFKKCPLTSLIMLLWVSRPVFWRVLAKADIEWVNRNKEAFRTLWVSNVLHVTLRWIETELVGLCPLTPTHIRVFHVVGKQSSNSGGREA